MPYEIVKEGTKYSVVNTETGEYHSHGTTKAKAQAQMRILESYDYSPESSPDVSRNSSPVRTGAGAGKSSWITFWASACKGKKFGSRAEINAYMKEMAKKYHSSKKGAGESILLSPGHGATTATKTSGFRSRII